MTNLQDGARPPSQALRSGLLVGVPIATGALLASLVVASGVWQPWSQVRDGQIQLDDHRAMEQRLPLLRTQRLQQIQQAEKLEGQQRDLLALIAGSGEITTFLAQMNREASASGVQLDVYEPIAAAPEPAEAGTGQKGKVADAKEAPPQDPLETQGLTKSTLLLSARGRYPALLDFLRRLELLSLLVVQSDLNLDLEAVTPAQQPPAPPPGRPAPPPSPAPIPRTQMKLNLSLYSKPPKEAAEQPARPAPSAATLAPKP